MTERDIHVVESPADDLAEGMEVAAGGKVRCQRTDAVLREGSPAVVRLAQTDRGVHWTYAGVFHPAAAPTDEPGSPDVAGTTVYAKGRLAVCSDAATQEATLRLVDAEVVSVHRVGNE